VIGLGTRIGIGAAAATVGIATIAAIVWARSGGPPAAPPAAARSAPAATADAGGGDAWRAGASAPADLSAGVLVHVASLRPVDREPSCTPAQPATRAAAGAAPAAAPASAAPAPARCDPAGDEIEGVEVDWGARPER
jgi:hypothetical protein